MESSKGAHLWHKDWLEEILSARPQDRTTTHPSPYLCLPLISVVKIARECGWTGDSLSNCTDPCAVCLENKCTVAASGCLHELCTRCALYLCSNCNTSTSPNGTPGSIPCPLCRHGIMSFKKLTTTKPLLKTLRPRSSLSCYPFSSMPTREAIPLCNPKPAFRSFRSQKFPSLKLDTNLCIKGTDTISSLVRRSQFVKYSRSSFRKSNSQPKSRRSWLCSLNLSV